MNSTITKLRKLKIELSLVDGRLKLNAPSGVLTPEIIEEIKVHKDYLIEYLNEILLKKEFSPIRNAVAKDYYVLSSAQKRIYFLYQFDRKSIAYNSPQVIELEGYLNKEKLSDVFLQLIARHDSLRTSFELIDGEPFQRIARRGNFEMELFKASRGELFQILNDFVRPFDLSTAPLIRVGLIQIDIDFHILIVDMHHIVTDGVSRGIFVKEFMELYNNKTLNVTALAYRDFAEWQQSHEQQQNLVRQKRFWLNEFSDHVSAADLLTDYPRPLTKSYAGNVLSFEIGYEDTRKLRALGDSTGASMFMILLSILNILIGKLSNSEDVVIGTTTAGRQQADLENIIGMFVNTLALRNHPKAELRFKDFLLALKAKALLCFDNQGYPYEELIDALKIPRHVSRTPLFDVMFAFQNFEISELKIPGLTLRKSVREHALSLFDLTLAAREQDDKILLSFEYSTALFRKEAIQRFVNYFNRIVSTVLLDSAVQISSIELLSEAEKTALLIDLNQTDIPLQEDTVVSLFEKQANKTPNSIAFRYRDITLPYYELNDIASAFASYLKYSCEIGRGDLVAVMLRRSEYILPCILGVLKAGAAYLPIDPDYSGERISEIIKDSKCKLLIIGSVDNGLNPEVRTVDVNVIWPHIKAQEFKSFTAEVSPNDLAYIIYTSGSTGSPKGVMIEHRSLANYCTWAASRYLEQGNETVTLFTSISFDLTVTSIFTPLISGNNIVIYDENERGLLIEQVMADNNTTVIKLTPSHLKIIRDLSFKPASNCRLKTFIVGGEELTSELAKSIYDKFSGRVTIFNEYGPTEATVGCMIYTYNPDDPYLSVPIGRPADNVQIYILDKFLKPVPFRVDGELFISGDGVARGYFSKPDLTRERFIPNPFREGKMMYKTGDLANALPNGDIIFKGRVDGQIKIRGFRIETAEIENQMLKHSLIKEAVVIAKKIDEDLVLVGYYTANREPSVSSLKDFLVTRLPEYMIPTYFVCLHEFLLTTNGKLDLTALPQPEVAIAEEYETPSTQIEERVAEIWARVLKLDKAKISINRSFFDLGGNSLKIVQLNAQINKDLNLQVSIPEMFRYTTISSFVKFMNGEFEDSAKYKAETIRESMEMQSAIATLISG